MCTQVKCGRCGKPTWSGCGRHIEQALANVPPEQRCRCQAEPKAPASGLWSLLTGKG
ncbi:MAG: hypothetical protein JNK82_12315 [Myxococcaceae bacterium]|nr:hypothetical protein [Myxococcaceae bacterium]